MPGGRIYPPGACFGAPRAGGTRRHAGVDLTDANPETPTPFTAAEAGTVVMAGQGTEACGLGVTVDHSPTVRTHYCHAASVAVTVGQRVARGQVLGIVGRTGNAGSTHLHFEVTVNGVDVDPAPIIGVICPAVLAA